MNHMKPYALAAALMLIPLGACSSYLTGGELTDDPNRLTSATTRQLFAATQPALWAQQASEMPRVTNMFVQYFTGSNGQYSSTNLYDIGESTTSGFYRGLYTGGGLVDYRKIQDASTAAGDKLFLGIAQVGEAFYMGTGADLFGDISYSQALKGEPPPLDGQLSVYDAMQTLLSTAITNLAAGGTGPGSSDLVYGGNAAKWTALAHTLKARFYLHTAEVRPAAYAQALAEANLGITDPANDYRTVFSGSTGEQNPWYLFDVVGRAGYLVPSTFFVNLLTTRADPRIDTYLSANRKDLSATRLDPKYSQRFVTANENLLIAAEAAYRGGDELTARGKLNAERALVPGLTPITLTVTGPALLQEILTEKYIALFQTIEAWNDYKRTCFPNVTPTKAGAKIPARFFYDAAERATNPNIPSNQPARNANDPANATDPFGNACLGQ
jgi:hypothetical protein